MRFVKVAVPYLFCMAVGIGAAWAVAGRGRGHGHDHDFQKARQTPAEEDPENQRPICYKPLKNVEGLAVTKPEQQGYRPNDLVKLGVNIKEIFAKEPRDRDWAEVLERAMGEKFLADLPKMIPTISGLSFECRTVLCRLSYDFKTSEDIYAVEDVLFALKASNRLNQTPDSEGKTSSIFLYITDKEGERLGAEPAAKAFGETRAQALARMRSGNLKVPASVTPGELPAD